MKSCLGILLTALFVDQFAIAAEPLFLHDATPIRMRLSRNLSSSGVKVGETADFEVLDEVIVDGVLLVARGSMAVATVTEAQSKRIARGGKLDVTIDFVRLVNGDKVALRASKDTKGAGYTGAITSDAPAPGMAFFMKGKDATVPKGTEITAYVNGEIKLDREKLTAVPVISPATAAAPVTATAAAPKRRAASLAITSDPASADIELNGKFIGNTPSTLELQPGPTNIVVKKNGFRGWIRTLDLSEGATISLRAELERETPSTVFVRPTK